mmetsp:Transcript_17295/g.33618  ORF Transcript_17295/g.33618 Transcript_17295/m.33618 type:complete len:243 (+) Transcript_17295:1023-1751(+)
MRVNAIVRVCSACVRVMRETNKQTNHSSGPKRALKKYGALTISKGIERSPRLSVHHLLDLRGTPLRLVNQDIRIRKIIRQRPHQRHIRIQNHDDGIFRLRPLRVVPGTDLLLVPQPVLQPMPHAERFVVILVVVPADVREIRREVDVEVGREFGHRRFVKGGQFFLLLGRAARGDADDVAGLADFVGEEEEDEGLPVLGGGAGGGEERVVGGEVCRRRGGRIFVVDVVRRVEGIRQRLPQLL